jgi:hypothetical protein
MVHIGEKTDNKKCPHCGRLHDCKYCDEQHDEYIGSDTLTVPAEHHCFSDDCDYSWKELDGTIIDEEFDTNTEI